MFKHEHVIVISRLRPIFQSSCFKDIFKSIKLLILFSKTKIVNYLHMYLLYILDDYGKNNFRIF